MDKGDSAQLTYELLAQLEEESPTAIYVADYENDDLLYLNSAAAKILGVDKNEIYGRKCFEFLMRKENHCPFCHKSMLKDDQFTGGTTLLPLNQRQYRIQSKLIMWEGRKAHIHYVTDETDLLNEQKQLRTLTDKIPGGVGIFYVYSDGRIEANYINDGYYAMIGTIRNRRREYEGFSTLEAVHKDDKKSLLQEVHDGLRENRQINHEIRVKRDDGSYMWVEIRADIVERTKERTILYCLYSDIDQLKRTQEELQIRYEEQVHLSRMLSVTSVASSMVNLTQNCITLQDTENEKIQTIITQQTPQQGFETMYTAIPDEEIRKQYALIFDCDKIIENFEKGITHKSIVHPYEHVDYWMESSYDAVRNPINGDLEVYCFARDVSEEVRQKSISEFLMSHQYEEVMLINPNTGEPTRFVCGGRSPVYEEQEKVGDYHAGLKNYFKKYCADEDAEASAEAASLQTVKDKLNNQDIYSLSYSVYDAEHKIVRKRATYAYINRYKSTILCTVQDITKDFENEVIQREKLENALKEAHRAIKAKSDFLSNMSHDMRTPMNAIIGLSNLAMDLENIEEYRDYMMKINTSGQQLLSLINDTLDVSRIENGKLTMNLEYVKCTHLLMEGISSAKVVAEQKGVNFNLSQVGVQDNLLYVDSLKIVKIFNNLLSNAIKFTPKGGTVTLFLKRMEQIGNEVNYLIVVKDTGIGMSQEFIKHIFEPFSQEQTGYETNATGTGLGMTIVKSMIDFLGGKIEIQSELNKGTEVSVWLTFQIAKGHQDIQETKKRQVDNSLSRKILVAEDHPINAMIIQKLLKKRGYESDLTSDGKQCVSNFIRAPKGEYAAILMDVRMPLMNGIEATKAIRMSGKLEAQTIPIIAMTANAFEQDIKTCLQSGMNAHLAKPVDQEKLYEMLERYTSDKAEENQI
ncbi:MAG: ATP-binding protein [Lachnospiraceae bacterium]|nr:ATP-binding protein [Lachnospiraceae bacterium]MDD3617131.1 ATP-binding protein [Lachnospiraceae bacterium]